MTPHDCDISKRVVSGKKYLDVLILDTNKRFSVRLTFESKKDNGGLATWYHKGKKLKGFWQFDKDGDVAMGLIGYKTNFAFSAKQLMAGESASIDVVPTQKTLSDTPFRF